LDATRKKKKTTSDPPTALAKNGGLIREKLTGTDLADGERKTNNGKTGSNPSILIKTWGKGVWGLSGGYTTGGVGLGRFSGLHNDGFKSRLLQDRLAKSTRGPEPG